MSIRIGIVGVGSFGSQFVSLFQKHPMVSRLALCEANPSLLAERAQKFGVSECYSSFEEACRSGLDALALFTQPWHHAAQAVAALEAGKHVYSAVPLASSENGEEVLEWCGRVIEACRRSGKHYMMGETSHFRPQAMYCRRRARAGDFGEWVHAEGQYVHHVDWSACSLREVYQARHGSQWHPSKSGGIPMHYPTHSLGGFLSVMDAHATHVCAWGHRASDDDWHREDTQSGNSWGNQTALLHLSNGATATIREHRWSGAWAHEGFSLTGTRGAFDDSYGLCRWMTREEPPAKPLCEDEMRDPLPEEVAAAWRDSDGHLDLGGHGGSHAYLVHEFVDAVANNRTPAINAWRAARYLAPGIVAHQSALRDGERLPVPDWGDAPSST